MGAVSYTHLEPLIGVSILVKGTATGAITDMDGNFKIQAAKCDVLELSLIHISSGNQGVYKQGVELVCRIEIIGLALIGSI